MGKVGVFLSKRWLGPKGGNIVWVLFRCAKEYDEVQVQAS